MASQRFSLTLLPVMPATADRVRRLLADPRSTHADFEQPLLHDPGATLALYQTVERIRPGAGEEITGPAHALSMIGHEAFRQTFARLPEIGERRIRHLLSPAFAWSQAAHAGWYAREIGALMGYGHPGELQVAALLQQPAVLWLWQHDFESAARATQAMRDGVPLEQAFGAELREPLRHANQRLARDWRLPRLAREAIGDWDPANRLPQSVSLAANLAETACAGWQPEAVELQATLLSELLPHHHRDAQTWWYRQTVEAARALRPLDCPLPARELLYLPGGEEEVELPPLPGRRRPAPKADLQARLLATLRGLLEQGGVERVVFAMLSRDRQRLRARLALGQPARTGPAALDLAVRQKHLFALLLGKRQSVLLSPDKMTRYAPYLDPLPLDAQARRGFYAGALVANNRPLGILYADGGRIDSQGYRRFLRHAGLVSRLLEKRHSQAA